MTTISFCGYHTCKLEGGYDYIDNNIPFLSKSGENQWLTQGYYFWTDDEYWAKRWGKKGNRVIGKFNIELCYKTELLDLVGNVSDQKEFVAYKNKLLSTLTKSQRSTITVNQIIGWCRAQQSINNGFFPYLAIKAEDGRSVEKIKFVDPEIDRYKNSQKLITPQQLCVFKNAYRRISLSGFVEPDDYAQKKPCNI